MSKQSVKLFISYSHRDESLRDELISHLSLLKRQKLIETWHDRAIVPGENFDGVIDENLESADFVLLLVSADFISSMYCWEKELERSLERHESGEAIVIPLIVRPVDLQGISFGNIQSLPTDRRPVTSWPNKDEAWVDSVRGLRKAIETFQERRRRSQLDRGFEGIGNILISGGDKLSNEALATGFRDLDQLTSGFHPADLIVIGSRPSVGKTALALNFAMNAAASSKPVGYFSLETAREQIVNRTLSAAATVDINKLRTGAFSDDEWPRINGAINFLKHAPLYIDDSLHLTTNQLLEKANKLKEEHGLELLVVDHLQLLQARNHQNQTPRDLARVSWELKGIARELNVPLIVTSQLSRKIDQRTDKKPWLADLPDGYDLDVHADLVLLLYREDYYDPYTHRRGVADICIAKQRNGPTGEVTLAFLEAYSRFHNLLIENELPLGTT